MAIGSALKKGNFVYVYDEKGRQLFSQYAGGKDDALLGYTASTVTIKKGNFAYTYNEKGSQISSQYVG